VLRDFQNLLGAAYDIELTADVREYLITDAAALHPLAARSRPEAPEKLLLLEDEGELAMALYVESALLDRLARADPRERLSDENLGDFCTAVEGVSHLNYVAWNAGRDKCVTLLELEMQAEVDKYVATRLLLADQPGSGIAEGLFERLFENPKFDSSLSVSEAIRYRDANRLASRYCRVLEKRYQSGRVPGAMLGELRAFFRLPQPAKVDRIRTAARA
jgi:hypothetical protein